MNLFLASHASGNIYLYDANHQIRPNLSPVYTKLYETDSFSLFINNQVSSSSSSTQAANNIKQNTSKATLNNNNTSQTNLTNTTATNVDTKNQQKLVLLNSNQKEVQMSKNPMLKWTIGSSQTDEFPNKSNCSGENSVNEFAISPCGSFVAVVSQDGYLRVFYFAYNNENYNSYNVQLRCSMKSYFGGLLCVTWSSDGKYIATGGEDDMISIFSFLDMRVACRGRGHSSWINCIAFDPWTQLNNSNQVNKKDSNENLQTKNEESNSEDYHNQMKNLIIDKSNKPFKVPSAKKRTISTLSDFNCANLAHNSNKSVYYRLASCGQDNQVCFWDLTEECLREKSNQNSSRSRSFIHNSSHQVIK